MRVAAAAVGCQWQASAQMLFVDDVDVDLPLCSKVES